MAKKVQNENNNMTEMEDFESFQKRVATIKTIQEALLMAKAPIWNWEKLYGGNMMRENAKAVPGNKTIFYKASIDRYGINKLEPVFNHDDLTKPFGKKGELYDKLADIKDGEMLIVGNNLNGARMHTYEIIVKHNGKFGILGDNDIKSKSFLDDIIEFFKNIFRSAKEKDEIQEARRTAKEEHHKYKDIQKEIDLVLKYGRENTNIMLFKETDVNVVDKAMKVAGKPAEALHYLMEKSYDKSGTLQDRAAGMLAFNIYKRMLQPEKFVKPENGKEALEQEQLENAKRKFEEQLKGENALENVKLLVENLKKTKIVKDIIDEHRLETLRDLAVGKDDKEHIYKKTLEELRKVKKEEMERPEPVKTHEKHKALSM